LGTWLWPWLPGMASSFSAASPKASLTPPTTPHYGRRSKTKGL
jgi:hypothetical protein